MRSKNALRNMIRKLLKLGYVAQAKKLLEELEVEQVYYEEQGGIKRIEDKKDFTKDKVVSLEEYKRSRNK